MKAQCLLPGILLQTESDLLVVGNLSASHKSAITFGPLPKSLEDLRWVSLSLLQFTYRENKQVVCTSGLLDQQQRNQVSHTLLLFPCYSIHHTFCNKPLLPSLHFSK